MRRYGPRWLRDDHDDDDYLSVFYLQQTIIIICRHKADYEISTFYRTRCSAIAESPRCRVRYSFPQSRTLELGDNDLRTL